MNKVDISSLLSIAFVALLAITAYLLQSELMLFLRMILERGQLKAILLLAVVVIVLTHAIKVKPENDTSNVMIRSGVLPLDICLTLGTYMAVSSTACSLLEGALIQQVFGVEYFTKFADLDVTVLLGVAALLLWYVAFHMYTMIVELLFDVEEVSKAMDAGNISQ